MFITEAAASIPVEPFVSLGGIVITTGGALLAIWLRARLNRLDASTKPTSNGYTARTESDLAEIKDALTAVAKDVGGIRADHRVTNRRLDTLTDRFNEHLDNRKDV